MAAFGTVNLERLERRNLASQLDGASQIAAGLALTPGPVGIIGGIAALALKVGAAFALQGKDPVIEITRMLSAAPDVQAVLDERDKLLDKVFGDDEPPVAGDDSDPYEGDDHGNEEENQPP